MEVDQGEVGQVIGQLPDHVDLLLLGRLVDGRLGLEVVDRGAIRRARAQQGCQAGLVPCGGWSGFCVSLRIEWQSLTHLHVIQFCKLPSGYRASTWF